MLVHKDPNQLAASRIFANQITKFRWQFKFKAITGQVVCYEASVECCAN